MSNILMSEVINLARKKSKKFRFKNGEIDLHNFITYILSSYPNASKEENQSIVDVCVSIAY